MIKKKSNDALTRRVLYTSLTKPPSISETTSLMATFNWWMVCKLYWDSFSESKRFELFYQNCCKSNIPLMYANCQISHMVRSGDLAGKLMASSFAIKRFPNFSRRYSFTCLSPWQGAPSCNQ